MGGYERRKIEGDVGRKSKTGVGSKEGMMGRRRKEEEEGGALRH